MPLIAIEETAYDAIEANEEDALRWVNADLALGVPAFYDDDDGVTWLVFDHRMTLTQVAWWACLMDNMRRVGRLWQAPKKADSDDVDREACAVEVQAMVADRVVLPGDIAYTEDDTNPWQVTLDAQGVSASDMQAFGVVPDVWVARGVTL